MQKTQCHVISLTQLTSSIKRVFLKPDLYIPYKAGQYLNIEFGDEQLSYSIANAPFYNAYYELHIRHDSSSEHHQQLLQQLVQQQPLTITLPLGECHSDQLQSEPVIFIAGGTGFAPIKAIVEEQLARPAYTNPLKLLWAVRTHADLYLLDAINNWQKNLRFDYHSFLSPTLLKSYILDYLATLEPGTLKVQQFVISGPFEMVWSIHDVLLELGVSKKQMHSDAFSFLREKK